MSVGRYVGKVFKRSILKNKILDFKIEWLEFQSHATSISIILFDYYLTTLLRRHRYLHFFAVTMSNRP